MEDDLQGLQLSKQVSQEFSVKKVSGVRPVDDVTKPVFDELPVDTEKRYGFSPANTICTSTALFKDFWLLYFLIFLMCGSSHGKKIIGFSILFDDKEHVGLIYPNVYNDSSTSDVKSIVWEGPSGILTNGNQSQKDRYFALEIRHLYGLGIRNFTADDLNATYKLHLDFDPIKVDTQNITKTDLNNVSVVLNFEDIKNIQLTVEFPQPQIVENIFEVVVQNEKVKYNITSKKRSAGKTICKINAMKKSSLCHQRLVLIYLGFQLYQTLLNGCDNADHTSYMAEAIGISIPIGVVVTIAMIVGIIRCKRKRRSNSRQSPDEPNSETVDGALNESQIPMMQKG